MRSSCIAGCQEIHIAGAGLAGLAFAIRIAENTPVSERTLICIWDGRLQRTGMPRKRRLAFRSHGKEDVAQVRRELSSVRDHPPAQARLRTCYRVAARQHIIGPVLKLVVITGDQSPWQRLECSCLFRHSGCYVPRG